ncbi:MAG: hypothetical protein HGA51_00930 [Demequinaceae bacterium]|nr:hypothetical protein [Demequinaceae bacterium]
MRMASISSVAVIVAFAVGAASLPANASTGDNDGNALQEGFRSSEFTPIALPYNKSSVLGPNAGVATQGVPIFDRLGNVLYVAEDGKLQVPEAVLERSLASLDDDSYEYQGVVEPSSSSEVGPPFSLFGGGCTPVSGADSPHKSGTYVSAHGSWEKGTCTNPTALVTTCLYEAYGDANHNFVGWYLLDCAERTVKPGTSKRANVRVNCPSTATTGFLNIVDVDVVGQNDTSETASRENNVNCRID